MKLWFKRHTRFHIHFTPTSSSWLNLVERLFAEITRQRIRRGTFTSVCELKTAIDDWIKHRNHNPKVIAQAASSNDWFSRVSLMAMSGLMALRRAVSSTERILA